MTDSQSPAARARPQQADDRRRQLLAVAEKLFVTDGYQATSVSAIVRAAGVAQGTFYLYFKSKEQLLVHLRGRVLKDYVATLHKTLEVQAPADERLVTAVAELSRSVKKHQALVKVFREATTGDETERVWIEGRETLAEPLATLLSEGIEDGSFKVSDTRMAAHLVLAVFDPLLYEALQYGKPAGPQQTYEAATGFTLRALGVAEDRIDELIH